MSTAKEIRDQNAEKQKRTRVTHVTNLNSDINNPCVKEHVLSHKCLNDNNYNRESCELYFMNYKNCKDFWYQISAERRKKGIKPYLPVPEDREEIKKGYLKANLMK